jgi:ABC-type lipoprotein release transport system permease subunit
MTFGKFWVIAFRDLGRNWRRTGFTLVGVALGMMVLILMSGFITGIFDSILEDSIRLQTGHLQLRADTYLEEKVSLQWGDLLDNPDQLADEVQSMKMFQAATPLLWASGRLSTIQESAGVRLTGIDPGSSIHDHLRVGLVSGEYLTPEGRGELLMGRRLAEAMEIGVGQKVHLSVGNADGQLEEGIFTVKGLFSTGFPGYDENTILLPISQLQAFTGAGDRASAVVVMLHERGDADEVGATLRGGDVDILTWEEMNSVVLAAVETGITFYYILYAIVILVVAVIIANTLLMAVFERTREIGILAALGMKKRQILSIFLLESVSLALVGILIGVLLGSALVIYFSNAGIDIGESSASLAGDMVLGTSIYTKLTLGNVFSLSFWMLAIIVLVSLYPAWYAARLEPVSALHAL